MKKIMLSIFLVSSLFSCNTNINKSELKNINNVKVQSNNNFYNLKYISQYLPKVSINLKQDFTNITKELKTNKDTDAGIIGITSYKILNVNDNNVTYSYKDGIKKVSKIQKVKLWESIVNKLISSNKLIRNKSFDIEPWKINKTKKEIKIGKKKYLANLITSNIYFDNNKNKIYLYTNEEIGIIYMVVKIRSNDSEVSLTYLNGKELNDDIKEDPKSVDSKIPVKIPVKDLPKG